MPCNLSFPEPTYKLQLLEFEHYHLGPGRVRWPAHGRSFCCNYCGLPLTWNHVSKETLFDSWPRSLQT